MKLKSMQCPNCGGKLEARDNGMFRCSSCLSEFLEEKKEAVNPASSADSSKKDAQKSVAHLKLLQTQKRNSRIVIRLFILLGIAPIVIVMIVLGTLRNNSSTSWQSDGAGANQQGSQETVSPRERPESEAMVAFAEQVFLKPISQITSEDLASIRYLELTVGQPGIWYLQNQWVFHYSLAPYEENADSYPVKEIRMSNDLALEKEDFSSLTGLEYLDYAEASMLKGSAQAEKTYSKLENLHCFFGNSSQSLTAFDSAVKDKTAVKGLSCEIRSESDVDKLFDYPNLTQLYVTFVSSGQDISRLQELKQIEALSIDMYTNPDLSFLPGLTSLKSLTMTYARKATDFSVFFELVQLEELILDDAGDLKSIDFVMEMPALKSFSLNASQLQNLEALRGKESLTRLELTENRQLKDATAISTLTSLTDVKYRDMTTDAKISKLSNPDHLKKADVESDFFEMIGNGGNLTDLTLNGSKDLSGVNGRYPKLETLTIENAGASSEPDFSSLPSLRVLRMNYSSFSGAEGKLSFFKMPQLEELSLKSTHFTLDPAYIQSSEKLKTLKIQGSTLYVNRNGQTLNEGLAPFQDKFAGFTGLEELAMPSAKLESLDFVSSMKKLRILDVSDNYIKDATPLLTLNELRLIDISSNPLQNKGELSEELIYFPKYD